MALAVEDRVAIADLINMHGHLADSGQLDRMAELFTHDVTYDLSDLGLGVLVGRSALLELTYSLGDNHPVGHHVTNIVLTEVSDDEVRAESKAIAIMADGRCGSAVYHDTATRGENGWRISRRAILGRRAPLGKG